MGVTTAIVATSLLATGAGAYQQKRAEKAQNAALGQQERQRQTLLSQVGDDDSQDQASAAARDQRRVAAAAQGRSDTIKTGQLGVTDPTPGTQKSLLGR